MLALTISRRSLPTSCRSIWIAGSRSENFSFTTGLSAPSARAGARSAHSAPVRTHGGILTADLLGQGREVTLTPPINSGGPFYLPRLRPYMGLLAYGGDD